MLKETDNPQVAVDNITDNIARRIAAMPNAICPVDIVLSYVQLCHAQSCGKCTPCRIGLGQVETFLRKILENEGTEETLELLKSTAQVILDSSDCMIGSNAAGIVLRCLDAYRDDFVSHVREHRCTATHSKSVPCMNMCPADVDIPGYISLIEEGRSTDAVRLIRRDNPFATACAYVCTHPCEKACRRTIVDAPINIRGLKKYAVETAEKYAAPECAAPTGKRVAIIGGGPAGVTAAYFLTQMGHKAVIYERNGKLGGMLRYGIPSYRFPREKLDEELEALLSVGIEVHTGVDVGKDITMEQLRKEYDSIFIAIGAQSDNKARIEGENADGVLSAVEFLHKLGEGEKPDLTGKTVAIVGGGNVAMDATRSAVRLGAKKVICVYRRRKCDMTADAEEVEGAMAEGAEILTLQSPEKVEVDENGKAVALWTQPQIVGAIDDSGRPRPEKADKPIERIEADVIVMAIGQAIESKQFEEMGIPTRRGRIMAGNDTSIKGFDGIFSGGDCVTGPVTAIRAIAAGKAAAGAIDQYLGFNHKISVDVGEFGRYYQDKKAHGRINIGEREAFERKDDFDCIEGNMSKQESENECSRCLHCNQFGCGNFKGGRKEEW